MRRLWKAPPGAWVSRWVVLLQQVTDSAESTPRDDQLAHAHTHAVIAVVTIRRIYQLTNTSLNFEQK